MLCPLYKQHMYDIHTQKKNRRSNIVIYSCKQNPQVLIIIGASCVSELLGSIYLDKRNP